MSMECGNKASQDACEIERFNTTGRLACIYLYHQSLTDYRVGGTLSSQGIKDVTRRLGSSAWRTNNPRLSATSCTRWELVCGNRRDEAEMSSTATRRIHSYHETAEANTYRSVRERLSSFVNLAHRQARARQYLVHLAVWSYDDQRRARKKCIRSRTGDA